MDSYQTVDSLGQPHSQQELKGFVPLTLLSQALGVLVVVLVAIWMGSYKGGFSWTDHAFNFHPLFMVLGMVFMYADAILVYRIFRHNRKMSIKILHAMLHILALLFSIIGLRAVFYAHNINNAPNMYSLHSWLGLATVILYCIQWLIGFLAFLYPKFSEETRCKVLHFHVVVGNMLFGFVIATVLMGITELNFGNRKNYEAFGGSEMFGNALGITVVIFGALVMYLINKREYRRVEPLEDERIQLKD
jgi:cytochrome b-561